MSFSGGTAGRTTDNNTKSPAAGKDKPPFAEPGSKNVDRTGDESDSGMVERERFFYKQPS